MDKFGEFAATLREYVLEHTEKLAADPSNPCKINATNHAGGLASIDLTPFNATKQPANAATFFAGVNNLEALIDAYHTARTALPFEIDVVSHAHPQSDYANLFLEKLFANAQDYITDDDVTLIVDWIKHFDVYVSVKCIESLLNSKADMTTFKTAKKHGWHIHFDHLAIRCGSSKHNDVEAIVQLLKDKHGYCTSQIQSESRYQFPDGWNAIPLYKILDNGHVLRLFLDQSDADDKQQIIQHWNYVYGFTAHHLAMHATKIDKGQRTSIRLSDFSKALKKEGVNMLQPVGDYTEGLLEQVFTRPEHAHDVPNTIKQHVNQYAPGLDKVIENGKLLELLCRDEMPHAFAKTFFALYGIEFDVNNPHHSAPIFPYFLPAQAAHVIRTSQELE